MKSLILGFGVFCAIGVFAAEGENSKLRYTYSEKLRQCVDSGGRAGLNTNYIGTCGNLRGADLAQAELEGINLMGADLSDSNLQNANLTRANLRGAKLVGAVLNGTRLTKADLLDAVLDRATLYKADLFGADLQNVSMIATSFEKAKTELVHWAGARFTALTRLPFDMGQAMRRGMVHLTRPMNFGDFNLDGRLNVEDLNVLAQMVGTNHPDFDRDDDAEVTQKDIEFMVTQIFKTQMGDTDLNGIVNQADLATIRKNLNGRGGWAQGDLNADGLITLADLKILSGK